MKPFRKKTKKLEKDGQEKFVAWLYSTGYTLVKKTHGGSYSVGWPDLYCYHPVLGHEWFEMKREGGRLTRGQKKHLPLWEKAGIGVVVVVWDFKNERPEFSDWKAWL